MHMVSTLFFYVPAGYYQDDIHLPHVYETHCYWPEPKCVSESWIERQAWILFAAVSTWHGYDHDQRSCQAKDAIPPHGRGTETLNHLDADIAKKGTLGGSC